MTAGAGMATIKIMATSLCHMDDLTCSGTDPERFPSWTNCPLALIVIGCALSFIRPTIKGKPKGKSPESLADGRSFLVRAHGWNLGYMSPQTRPFDGY